LKLKHNSVKVGHFALVTERVGTGDDSTLGRLCVWPLNEHAIKRYERLWVAQLVHGDVAACNLTIDSIGRVIILDLQLEMTTKPDAITRDSRVHLNALVQPKFGLGDGHGKRM
jgi:hypothetical protein